MKQDAQKEYQSFLDRKCRFQSPMEILDSCKTTGRKHRETLGMVDRSPHFAASSCPHLDLFPSLEPLDQASEEVSARLYAAPVHHHHSHSMPMTPTMEFFAPAGFPSPPYYTQDTKNEQWQHSSSYAPPNRQCKPHGIPELRISRAPGHYGSVAMGPSLRTARSADNLDNIGDGR